MQCGREGAVRFTDETWEAGIVMRRRFCKSKIHRATVTGTVLDYEGSITLDPMLMEAADIVPFEQVHVLNVGSSARFETYAIRDVSGSGQVVLNGPAARLVQPGDTVIILSYADLEEAELTEHEPRLLFVDERNRIRPDENPALRVEEA